MRLDRWIANSGYGSRSDVKTMIRGGRVLVNGHAVCDPGIPVDPDSGDCVTVDGELLHGSRYIYLALYKPDGYLTALEDRRLPTVADLIPAEFLHKGVSPVGRLDFHTTGLLLLTNNGVLSHRLTNPKWHAAKEYIATHEGLPLTDKEVRLFGEGMILQDIEKKPERLAPAELTVIDDHTCRLVLTEGKTHQVKRMLAAVERPVIRLHRESIGGIRLGADQAEGTYRPLTQEEIGQLLLLTKLSP